MAWADKMQGVVRHTPRYFANATPNADFSFLVGNIGMAINLFPDVLISYRLFAHPSDLLNSHSPSNIKNKPPNSTSS